MHLRVGDLELQKEDFSNALKEYESSKEILLLIEDNQKSRKLAEIFYLIGNCILYENKENNLKRALESYGKGI